MKKMHWGRFLILNLLCLALATSYPIDTYAEVSEPYISASSAILYDVTTKTVLYDKNMNEKHYPASITKLMTALLSIENLKSEDIITFSEDAIFGIERGSSHIGLDVGEKLSVDNALRGLLLMSANEVANGLAEQVSGTQKAFAERMTARAKSLGCQNTHFMNAHGLDDPEHYTTAYDMALIAAELSKKPYFLEIMNEPNYVIPATNKSTEVRHLAQQHRMLNFLRDSKRYREDVIGGKTGYTDIARHTLVTIAREGDMCLVSVVLQGEKLSIYDDTNALLDYGFDSFEHITIPTEAPLSCTLHSSNYNGTYLVGSATLTPSQLPKICVPKGCDITQLTKNCSIPDKLYSDVKLGEVVGSITYSLEDKEVASIPLIVSQLHLMFPDDITPDPYSILKFSENLFIINE